MGCRVVLSFPGAPLVTSLLLVLGAGCTTFAGNATPTAGDVASSAPVGVMTFRPVQTDMVDVVVNNPGKGWLLFGEAKDLSDYPEILELGTVGYARFNWRDIEPEKGRFDWSVIDNRVSAWAALGKQFAFRVMAANTHAGEGEAGKWVTPQWVFDAGAAYRTYYLRPSDPYGGLPGEKVVPVWNDPVFEQQVQDLVTALAGRYDGDPNVAFIDIGTYGNWGEQHVWPFGGPELSPGELQEHITWYIDAFAQTRLVNVVGDSRYFEVYYWCVDKGVGLRRDGVLGASLYGDEVAIAYDEAPGVFEWHRSYVDMVAGGYWDPDRFWKSLYTGRPTYQGMYWMNDPIVMYEDEGPLVREAANKLGYHFVLTEAAVPLTLGNGQTDVITLTWRNEGVAPIYVPAFVGLALLDDDDNVLRTALLDGIDPSGWKPKDRGQEVFTETAEFSFPYHASGAKIAVGLSTDPSLTNPDIRLGIEGGFLSGWYVLWPGAR